MGGVTWVKTLNVQRSAIFTLSLYVLTWRLYVCMPLARGSNLATQNLLTFSDRIEPSWNLADDNAFYQIFKKIEYFLRNFKNIAQVGFFPPLTFHSSNELAIDTTINNCSSDINQWTVFREGVKLFFYDSYYFIIVAWPFLIS